MAEFEVVEVEAQHAAVLRAEVPMAEIRDVFDRGFGLVAEAVQAQGLAISGPPFGYYPRMPTDTVEVAVGFPVSGAFEPAGEVEAMDLPGGRVVQGTHVGPYDALEATYGQLVGWAQAEGLELADAMWESYLSDPVTEPDPAAWRTLISWPLRG